MKKIFETCKDLFIKYREIVSYLFWGVMTTLVSWGTYALFAIVINLGDWTVTVANCLSWICAVTFAFVVNKMWVFESKEWKPAVFVPELVKFYSMRLATGLIEMAGVPILVGVGMDQTIFGVEGMAAKVLVSVIVVILNYIFSKLLIFKKSGDN